jgi:hypothetical protein
MLGLPVLAVAVHVQLVLQQAATYQWMWPDHRWLFCFSCTAGMQKACVEWHILLGPGTIAV